jgi:putative two-component system response regulator
MEQDNSKALVLIVDDNSTNIDLLVNTLRFDYRLGIAKNGPKAIEYAGRYHPDLILLDIMMPDMNGFEVCNRLKADARTGDIPVIFITALTESGHKTRGFEVGGVDYITKPFHAAEVKARVRTHLAIRQMTERLNAQNVILEQKVVEKTAQLRDLLRATLEAMSLALEMRDPYTAGHQKRVARLACAIAIKLGLSQDRVEGLHFAGILHDIGKIRIPVSILSRPGKLLPAEMEMLRIHPEVSYEMLRSIPAPWPIAEMVRQHHEKIDGSGYPRGLTKEQMLLEGRILAVADATEAESSYRPYRPARGIEMALEQVIKQSGTSYDPEVVDVCVELFRSDGFSFEANATASDKGQGPGDGQDASI